jgi:hypothetical protein
MIKYSYINKRLLVVALFVVLGFFTTNMFAQDTKTFGNADQTHKLLADANMIINRSVAVDLLNATQADKLKSWLSDNNSKNDIIFIIFALTYRASLINKTQSDKVTQSFNKQTSVYTLPMLNMFKLLYIKFELLNTAQLAQLNNIIEMKKNDKKKYGLQ